VVEEWNSSQMIPSLDIKLAKLIFGRNIVVRSWTSKHIGKSSSSDVGNRSMNRLPSNVILFWVSQVTRLLEISLLPLTKENMALETFRHNPTNSNFTSPPAARVSEPVSLVLKSELSEIVLSDLAELKIYCSLR